MIETRVQTKTVVGDQVPFVRSESPLFVDFLETYYASQEFEGGTLDISQNIDQYVKVGTYSSIVSITLLDGDVGFGMKLFLLTQQKDFQKNMVF